MSTSDNYSPAPPPPPQPGPGAGAPAVVPPSVDLAGKLLLGVIALAAVSAIATFLMLDTVVAKALEADTTGILTENQLRGTAIGAGIGSFVVTAAVGSLLYVFWRKGAGWARVLGIIIGVLSALFALGGLIGGNPPLFIVLSLIQAALAIGIVVLLLRPDSSQFFNRGGALQ